MNTKALLLSLAAVAALCCGCSRGVRIFNGDNLDGWTAITAPDSAASPDQVFSAKDGAISVTGQPLGYIRTNGKYSDFTLSLEWRWSGGQGYDSGIYVYLQDGDKVWPQGVQCQLKGDELGMIISGIEIEGGELRGNSWFKETLTDEKVEKPVGEWNETRIVCKKGNCTVYINGALINSTRIIGATEGYIGMQSEGGPIEFRNIVLR